MPHGKFATCVLEIVAQINAVVGEGSATVRDERAGSPARTDVGFGGAQEGDRVATPSSRERATLLLSVRSIAQARSTEGTLAVLDRHEAAITALVRFVPSPAQNLNFGTTSQVNIQLQRVEAVSVETELILRLELERR